MCSNPDQVSDQLFRGSAVLAILTAITERAALLW